MNPTTHEDWLAVARERAADAEAMMPSRENSTGPIYMAGYAIECSIKAYLQCNGISFPIRGREGHNLRGLWGKTGFRLGDLIDINGAKAFYLLYWSTELRYADTLNISGLSNNELLIGARHLTGWFHNMVRRSRKGK